MSLNSRLQKQSPLKGDDRLSVQQMLDQEVRPVPEVLRDTSSEDLGTELISKERYTSSEFARAEMEKMWSRVWQMACREEDIPSVGDYYLYEIGDTSLIVTRVQENEIRAYYNACLHRGRKLCDESGHGVNFRCPFHGFTWNLNGSIKSVTSEWDFQHIDREKFSLPQAQVGRWGGFVFVNLSDESESLESYLEEIPNIYETRDWPLSERVKTVHVEKHYDCNWKVALEAFIESFHVVATHPGAMTYLGDAFTQYDVWPDRRHSTRMISPRGMHSPHIGPLSDEKVYRAGIRPFLGDEAESATLPPGKTPRAAMADVKRAYLKETFGRDFDHITDCEALDTIQYHIFPNLVCWAGYGSFIVYRFRPDVDPDRCFMEIMFLTPRGERVEGEAVKTPTRLAIADSHHKAPQLGSFCSVFDEDMSNLGSIQKGLKTMKGPGITLGNYQEMRIRRFHQTLDSYLREEKS